MNAQAIVGQDGCESLLPSNIATQRFQVYQIIPLPHQYDLKVTPPASPQVPKAAPHKQAQGYLWSRTGLYSQKTEHIEFPPVTFRILRSRSSSPITSHGYLLTTVFGRSLQLASGPR